MRERGQGEPTMVPLADMSSRWRQIGVHIAPIAAPSN